MDHRFEHVTEELASLPSTESDVEVSAEGLETAERVQLAIRRLERRRRLGDQIGVFYMTVIVPLVLGWIGFGLWREWKLEAWLLGIGAPVVLGVIAAIFWSLSRTQRAGAELAELDDPESVGPLLEAYAYCEWDRRSGARVREALIQMLPNVQRGDLTDGQLKAMARLLTRNQRGLRHAILTALERAGDSRAIPAVRRLTQSRDETVRTAAEDCLAVLEVRSAETREQDSLLRPAADSGEDALLRAARSAQGSAGDTLVRPVTGSREQAQADGL